MFPNEYLNILFSNKVMNYFGRRGENSSLSDVCLLLGYHATYGLNVLTVLPSRDQTIIRITVTSSTGESLLETTILQKFNCHWLRTILSPLSALHSSDSSNSLKPSYVTDLSVSSVLLHIHLNQFRHPEDGGITFLKSIRTFIHHMVQEPKWPSYDQQPLWKPENLQFTTLLNSVSFCTNVFDCYLLFCYL
jgi:hypothetical protein